MAKGYQIIHASDDAPSRPWHHDPESAFVSTGGWLRVTYAPYVNSDGVETHPRQEFLYPPHTIAAVIVSGEDDF